MADTPQSGKRKQSLARPIKSKRDYEAAMSVTQKLLAMPNRDTAAESRLKALLEEMDRFDDTTEDADEDFSDASSYGGASRRWSDD